VKLRRGAGRTESSQRRLASAVERLVARYAWVAKMAAQSESSAVATPKPSNIWSVLTIPLVCLTLNPASTGVARSYLPGREVDTKS